MENKFLSKLNNIVVVNIKSKNIDRLLNNIYKSNIEIFNLTRDNYKELNIEIYESDLDKIKKFSVLNKVKIISYKGKSKIIRSINKNKVVFMSLFIGLIFLMFLSNVIFSIEVVHSSNKLKNLIYSELNKNGIHKYQFKKSFNDLERIKNKILEENKDSIEWLEIITSGTKYIIKCEDRKINEYSNDYKYQDIIAKKDAVIKKIVATNGVKVKNVNDYVKKGDTVISGSIYLNDAIKGYVKATGTIYGEVWYKLSIEYPVIEEVKEETGNKKEVYSFNFLNKRVPIFSFKKYEHSNIVSKNIFKNNILPISITKDTEYELNIRTGIYTEGEALLNAREYAKDKMQSMLGEFDYIMGEKVLNYRVNSNIIYMEMFYKVYEDITSSKEIIEEVKEE